MSNQSESVTFADLGLRAELLEALNTQGYEEPTPIQRESIPHLIEGRDLLGQAATGTGKTAAFALPMLQRMQKDRSEKRPFGLVLVPTRELAVQVSEAMHKYGKGLGTRVLPIYGGQPIGRQLQALDRGVDIVVATPGRAQDHINRKTLDLRGIEFVVLDEADEMLDMGFAEEIDEVLQTVPEKRQTVLFSATLPARINAIANRHLTNPEKIQIARETRPEGEAPRVRQSAYIVGRAHKAAAIGRILDIESPTAALVFCRTREQVDTLTESLNGRGYRAEALHGGMDQHQRDRVMGRLRSETADLLVATDVAARGLDIDHLSHVINYDVPSSPETYVHRIGRTGRAGREGVAITLAEPREHRMLKTIERVTKAKIEIDKLPTVADIRSRRMELTRAAVQESLTEDDLEPYRSIVEALTDEHDVMEVALAAVKLAHELSNASSDVDDIPEATIDLRDGKGGGKFEGKQGGRKQKFASSANMTRIFIGSGRTAGIRPQDLVGAIANEAGISGREIGNIEIADRFSLVEVPDKSVDGVISALKNTTIKGKKTTVRRERFPANK